jgi:hypothetical protein
LNASKAALWGALADVFIGGAAAVLLCWNGRLGEVG